MLDRVGQPRRHDDVDTECVVGVLTGRAGYHVVYHWAPSRNPGIARPWATQGQPQGW